VTDGHLLHQRNLPGKRSSQIASGGVPGSAGCGGRAGSCTGPPGILGIVDTRLRCVRHPRQAVRTRITVHAIQVRIEVDEGFTVVLAAVRESATPPEFVKIVGGGAPVHQFFCIVSA
jgi:hypothetical protein